MSQPFDNRDYDARRLAEKDAEIERLKKENWGYLEVAQKLKWALETSVEKDAEIERLKERLEESYAKQTYKEWKRNVKLIDELAEVLESYGFDELLDLIRRAREATRKT